MNLIRYIKIFKNWPTIFFNVSRKNFKFYVKYRDGRVVRVLSQAHLYFLSFYPKDLEYDQQTDIITFKFNGRQVRIKGGLNNGDLGSIFGELCYNVEVRGKMVLDIGANIGDSAIFFALEGASKVMAFEPIPSNFIILEQNVELNSLNGIIIPLKKGASASKKVLSLSTVLQGTTINASTTYASSRNEEIEFMALSEIVLKYKPHVLKIDCEGCEYEIFRNTPRNVIQMLDTIVGEYHNEGFGELEEIFKDAGFVCNVNKIGSKTGLFVARKLTQNTEKS